MFTPEEWEEKHQELDELPYNAHVETPAGAVWTRHGDGLWGCPGDPRRLNSAALVSEFNEEEVAPNLKLAKGVDSSSATLFDGF